MKNFLIISLLVLSIADFHADLAQADLAVIDASALRQLKKQLDELKNILHELQNLNKWEEIDHMNMDASEFAEFLTKYGRVLDELLSALESYDGGLLGQLRKLEDIYFRYDEGWDKQGPGDFMNEIDPYYYKQRRQILWTRIQLEHAATVAAEVRDRLPETEVELRALQQANYASDGVLLTLKIGNELTGMVARSVEVLNTQIGELLQAQIADGLEKNTREGLQKNRAREALQGWGEYTPPETLPPLNPFGAY